MLSAARTTVKAKEFELAHKLALRLLAGMCDAIAELDESMHIVSEAGKLAALLLKTNLVGVSFLDLMPAEEQTRFVEHMSNRVVECIDELVMPFKLCLRDVMGNFVRVQVSCSFLRSSLSGSCVFVVGASADEEPWHQRQHPNPGPIGKTCTEVSFRLHQF